MEKNQREVHYPVDSPEKVTGQIRYGAFSNPLMQSVLKKFGKKAFARSSALMEFEPFLKRINAGGKTCLEIGTYHGITAIILAQYFRRVVCVSVDNDPSSLLKHEIVKHLNIKNIDFIDLDNNSQKSKVIDKLDFDFCYMDGDHTHDTHTDFELVKRCGKVLFHEYWPIQAPVWNLVNSLPDSEVTRAEHDCFAYWKRGDK